MKNRGRTLAAEGERGIVTAGEAPGTGHAAHGRAPATTTGGNKTRSADPGGSVPGSKPIRAALAVLLAALLAGLAPAGAAAAGAQPDKIAVVRRAIEDVFRPAYRDLAARADEMAASQAALCAAPSDASLAAARERFAGLVGAFSRIEFVRFGPIMEDNRIERLLFWPDRRGVALRQVQAILGGQDETATDAAGLAAKSVAVQGLNALELVLFGTDAEAMAGPEGAFRCRYGAAVAKGIGSVADGIAESWARPDGIAKALTEPSAESPAYREIDDSLDELIATLVHGLEAIRDLRIQPGLGDTVAEANPKAWIFQRAGLTEASLQANVSGLADLFETSGLAALLPPADKGLETEIASGFRKAETALQSIGRPLAPAAGEAEARGRVEALLKETQALQHLFADRLAPALGLQAGFSSLDGD